MAMQIVHADALITGDRDVVRDGAVVVDDTGTVLAVASAADVRPRYAGLGVTRIHGVVLPGLVNAHTHVELSALRGQVPGGAGFVAWMERLIVARNEVTLDEERAAIDRAVEELDAAGTVAVGDISNSLAAVRPLARRGLGGLVFHEVFGIALEPAKKRVLALERERDERVGSWPGHELAYAPCPHTLYTTHPEVVRMLLASARALGRRTTLHLAEHPGERRALEHGDGPVVQWLERRVRGAMTGAFWPRRSPFAFAAELGALAADVLLVHLTDARPSELAEVAKVSAPVVICPRSNLHIETQLPPVLAMRAAGVEPALGTDSFASNASLDVLAEARALSERFPTIPAQELVQMATWNGARALGRRDLGRIAPGARPGLIAIEGAVEDDPAAFVLRNVRAPRRWVVRRAGGAP